MIHRSHLTFSLFFLFIVAISLPGQSNCGLVRSTFERLAKEIVVLGHGEFIYGFRENRQIPPKEFIPVREFTQLLENGKWNKSDFLPLLRHNDANVRTLAIVALYSLDDPQILPDIFPLVTDPAPTFVAMLPLAAPSFMEIKITAETTEKQTVGAIASVIIDTYMKSGGFNYGPLGKGREPGFPEYWKLHAGRNTSAGWWSVRLARASHSTNPTQRHRFMAIREVRAKIDQLPEPDRTWTLLRLNDDDGADVLVVHDELVGLLKKQRPDNLMDLLKRPGVAYASLAELSERGAPVSDATVASQVEIQAKYEGYVERQREEIARQGRYETMLLPCDLDYQSVRGLSIEVQQKLQQHRPETIGQASRISGITPAAISLLLVHLKRGMRAPERSAA